MTSSAGTRTLASFVFETSKQALQVAICLATMKRTRMQYEQADQQYAPNVECRVGSNGSKLVLTVQLPDQLAHTPVLSALFDTEGSVVLQQRPQCVLAWLTWQARRQAGPAAEQGEVLDVEVEAFNVRSRTCRLRTFSYPVSGATRLYACWLVAE